MFFKELSIVFNGEIYNYAEIRAELECNYNCSFVSHSDTEVILQAFYQWGIGCIHKFNGMFAIALYDKRIQKLYLIRDRAGVKPLYFYNLNGLFLFSSELKSFHTHPGFKKEIDSAALALFLQYGYIPAPHSIFKNCSKILPGHYIEYNLETATYTQTKYWDVYESYNKPDIKINYEDAIAELDLLLQSSFNYRMVSDVPVGVFLSGGYDSSTVAAILQSNRTEKIKTFTIGFEDERFNEAGYAKKVATYLGTDHTEHYCTNKEAIEIAPLLPYIFDEPFGDSSAIPTILVSKLAKEQVTVALSADGGDETFAGYNRYHKMLKNLQKIKSIPSTLHSSVGVAIKAINRPPFTNPSKQILTSLSSLLKNGVNAENYNKFILQRLSDDKVKKILKDKFDQEDTYFDSGGQLNGNNDSLAKAMAIDYKTYMVDDVLVKVDRAGMSVSLEGREPLLDYRIIEFAAQLPSAFKYENGVKKRIFKEVSHKYLPKQLMDRPKMGFGIPLSKWLRGDMKIYIDEYLNEQELIKQDIFNINEIKSILTEFEHGSDLNTELVWYLLMFQMWYKRWM